MRSVVYQQFPDTKMNISSFDSQLRPIPAVDGNHSHHPTAPTSSSIPRQYKLPTRLQAFTSKTPSFSGVFSDDLVAAVVPPVTVVVEGRCICHRISLHKHGSYQSLARALRHMLADVVIGGLNHSRSSGGDDVDLSNAIPGYLIAYEDLEDDLLLAGDLNWKDFVRVAKRIRILPAKPKSRN